jgi:predicted membrane protein
MQNKRNMSGPNFWLALTLIALGVLFLLDNVGVIYIGSVWQYWPLILIAIGVTRLTSSSSRERSSATILIGVGVIFMLLNLDFLDWDTVWQFWPVVLILIGISIIYGRSRRSTETPTDRDLLADDHVDAVAIFGGVERKISSQNFRGGNTTAIFGGTELNLGRAKLAAGDNELDVFAMFGGVELKIPDEWHVIIRCVPIFGGCEDSRRNVNDEQIAKDRTLIVKGLVLFGGIEIKSA